MRRLSTLGAALATLGVALVLAGPADAQTPEGAQPKGDPGRVSVVKATGLIDPVLADFIDRSITEGERAGVVAVVIRLDSSGSVVSDDRLAELAAHIHDASVPVGVWIGPSGSGAEGGAAQLAGAAKPVEDPETGEEVSMLGMAPGTRLGKTGELVVSEDLLAPAFVEAQDRLRSSTVTASEAHDLELTEADTAPIIGEFLLGVPGFESKQVTEGGQTALQPVTTAVFSALPVQDQLFHTVASPPAAYLLFIIGLSLMLFEFFTAGVGVAGLIGAGSFVLACYGLAILPVQPVSLGLLVLAMFGFAVDVQTGVPRVWSAIGVAALIIGSVTLYDGLSLSWVALLVGIGGVSMAMIAGMPAMVRTRFSTPTIGREWMIGEEGAAVTAVSPDGVVTIRGAMWRARTNRATPIASDEPIRVVEVDGLLLEVEPLEGGAVDYRVRRRGSDDGGLEEAGDDAPTGRVLVDGEPLEDV